MLQKYKKLEIKFRHNRNKTNQNNMNQHITAIKKEIVFTNFNGDISENIKRLLNDYNIKTVFRVDPKFDKYITLGKDHFEILDQSHVVYRLICQCGKTYVGQKKRPLRILRKEHHNNIKLNPKYYRVISKHLIEYHNGDIAYIY